MKNVKYLNNQEANNYLSLIAMEIGSWNQISYRNKNTSSFLSYQAPKDSRELYSFASHISNWLPKGNWKLLKMDNSSSMDIYDAYLLSKLLSGTNEIIDFEENRTFLFEFDQHEYSDITTEFLISNLVHLFLLYECHVQIVSLSSTDGQILSLQDGYVEFLSFNEDSLITAKSILKNYEKNPLVMPKWVLESMDILNK